MADIVSTPVLAVTVGGVTVLGVATGLAPELLFAGSCGGWWAASIMDEPQPLAIRVNNIIISSVIAAWLAPALTSVLCARNLIGDHNELIWQYSTAAVTGFMVVPVLGKLIMDGGQAARKALSTARMSMISWLIAPPTGLK